MHIRFSEPYMTHLADLKLTPLWLNPDHLAATAAFVMAGHNARLLAVCDGTDLVGVVVRDQVLAAPKGTLLREIMTRTFPRFDAADRLRQVAERFVSENLDYAVVLDGSQLRGIVTPNDLLSALGRSWDPMTDLPWSDELRAWAIDRLRTGFEVTLLFIDLDSFGAYNKEHGHLVGDRVLQRVTQELASRLVPETDVLVRYGGDEFAIGTLRDRADAEDLAAELRELSVVIAPEVRPVTLSVGVFGGRRTKERENVHFASTVDNLINLASKACLAEKRGKRQNATTVVPPTALVEVRPSIRVVGVFAEAATEVTTVVLSQGDAVMSGSDTREGKSLEASVAQATLRAMERNFPGVRLELKALTTTVREGQTHLDLEGRLSKGEAVIPLKLQRSSDRDSLTTVAETVISLLINEESHA